MKTIAARPRNFLGAHPMASAVVYVMTGALPLYLISAQVLSLEAELGFDPARLGIATATYFGVGALVASNAGRWIRSRGATSGLKTGCLLAAAAAIIAGSSPVWWVFPLATMVSGVANAFMQVGTNVLLVQIARSDRQAISFGAKQGAIPLASSLAGVLLPVVGLAVGWRWSFALAAMIALTVRTFVPDVPILDQQAPSDRVEKFRVPRPLLYLAIAGACGGAAGNAVSFFVVPSAVEAGITEAAAGSVLAVSSALVVALRIGSGWVVDRRRTSGHNEMALMLGVGVLGCVGLAFSPNVLIYLVAMTFAMNGSWGWPGLFYYTVTSTNPRFPAQASGVTLTGNLTGTLIGPLIVGQLADRGHYPAAWSLCAALSLVAFTSMVMSGRTFRSSIAGTGRSPHPAGSLSEGTT